MLLNVEQVKELLKVPQATAYQVIRDLNKELNNKGYLTIRGRVEETYLRERYRLEGVSE